MGLKTDPWGAPQQNFPKQMWIETFENCPRSNKLVLQFINLDRFFNRTIALFYILKSTQKQTLLKLLQL